MEGGDKVKYTDGRLEKRFYNKSFWRDTANYESHDYGLIFQYYFNIKDNLLVTAEGYYGLSKFSEDHREGTYSSWLSIRKAF